MLAAAILLAGTAAGVLVVGVWGPPPQPIVRPATASATPDRPQGRFAAPPPGLAAHAARLAPRDALDAAWATLARDPAAALQRFDAVLATADDPEAHHGRGVALLAVGRRQEARDALCAASRRASAPLSLAVDVDLRAAGLACGVRTTRAGPP